MLSRETLISMAARRASYIACDSVRFPKFAACCCSATSSTCASVIVVPPTVATISEADGGLAGCADVEQQTKTSVAASKQALTAMRIISPFPELHRSTGQI